MQTGKHIWLVLSSFVSKLKDFVKVQAVTQHCKSASISETVQDVYVPHIKSLLNSILVTAVIHLWQASLLKLQRLTTLQQSQRITLSFCNNWGPCFKILKPAACVKNYANFFQNMPICTKCNIFNFGLQLQITPVTFIMWITFKS